jgi:hypothetical protein
MNYKDWIKKTIGGMLKERDEEINLEVFEYSNANFSGGHKDCAIVINGLGGTTDADVEVVPIQLMCMSGTQFNADGEENATYDIFYEVLKEFCKTYNMSSMVLNDFDYYKHSYIQPFPINALESDAGSYRLNFVVSGSLTISREIQDIKEITINNQQIKFLEASLNYITALSGSSKISKNLTDNKVQNAAVNIQIRMYHRNNMLSNMAREIRQDNLRPNSTLDVKLKFSDDSVETYKMIISTFTLTSDRINPTIASVDLAIAE